MRFLGNMIRGARGAKRLAERAEAASFGLGDAGSNVSIGDGCEISSGSHVFLGSDVFIGRDCLLSAPSARIVIGDGVMLAPQVAVITGDHNISVVGQRMFDTHTKEPGDDLDVAIEDDVWIGFRAIILKGVRVGRGSVIAAGAVVTRDVPRYAIVAGTPAKTIGMRFSEEEIGEHERLLGIGNQAGQVGDAGEQGR